MATHLKLKFETFKKVPLSDDYRNIDGLKGLIRKLNLVNTDDFDLVLVKNGVDRSVLRIQKDLTGAIDQATDRCVEIEIRPRKAGVPDANPKSVQKSLPDDDSAGLVEVSQIMFIPADHPQTSPDDDFIEILSDESQIQLNNKQATQTFGKKGAPEAEFAMDEEEKRILEEIKKNKPTPAPQEPPKSEVRKDKEITALRMALEKALEDNQELALQLKSVETERSRQGKKVGPPHADVTCSSCRQKPLSGKRYVCVECPETNLCEGCESKGVHDHHMMVRVSQNTPNLSAKFRECVEAGKAGFLDTIRESIALSGPRPTGLDDRAQKISTLKSTLMIKDEKLISELIREFGHLPLDSFVNACFEKVNP
jgi:hypothetical protein